MPSMRVFTLSRAACALGPRPPRASSSRSALRFAFSCWRLAASRSSRCSRRRRFSASLRCASNCLLCCSWETVRIALHTMSDGGSAIAHVPLTGTAGGTVLLHQAEQLLHDESFLGCRHELVIGSLGANSVSVAFVHEHHQAQVLEPCSCMPTLPKPTRRKPMHRTF